MYPFIRMAKELFVHRNAPPLALEETHVSHHMCWPWDLDFWLELNNGRTLTLLDLGRIPMARRVGLLRVVRENGWGMTVAGVSVRYRRRIRIFQKVEMHTRSLGWDDRFLYLEQSLWNKKGDCTSHALYRMAVTSKEGIVQPGLVADALGVSRMSPELPDWVEGWIQADATRPWPPQTA